MSAHIIEVGDFRLHRERYAPPGGCEHKYLTLNDAGEFVTCDDCQKQVGTYAALRMLIERWAALQNKVDRQCEVAAEAMAKTLSLRAAQRVEKSWRSKSMVPTCPHCREPIYPTDGLGSSLVNREIADRRRQVAASVAASPPSAAVGMRAGREQG